MRSDGMLNVIDEQAEDFNPHLALDQTLDE